MEKYTENKPPILIDTSFWKTIYDYWSFIETTAFFLISLAPEVENRTVWMIVYFSVTFISEVMLGIVSYTLLKAVSLMRVIVRRIFPLLFFFVVFASAIGLQKSGYTIFGLVFAISIVIVISVILLWSFQKRIDNSTGILNYMLGEIVSTDVDQQEKDRKSRIITRIIVIAAFSGYIVWYIIVKIVQ
jgi:hypothetical protein